jgi:hypothetical protein
LEQKPQEDKQGHEVQGGVVFAKPRQKAPVAPPNPMQALFQNKPALIVIGLLVAAAVVFGIIKIVGSSKKGQAKPKEAAVTAGQQEKKQAESAKTAQPEKPAVQEKKPEGETAEPADVKLTQEGAVEPLESVAYKPPPKKQQPKKVKDTPGLTKMLDDALIKGNESALSYAVMGIEKNGDDVVDYLKEKIISNFDKPAVRTNAILALFYSSNADAVAVVKTALKVDSDEEVRLTALSVLDSLCGQEEIEFIQGIAKQDQSERVRKKALEYVEARSIGQ